MSSHPGHEMSEQSRDSPTCLLFSKTLLAVFVLSLAVWTPQTSESQRTDPLIFSSIMVPDFTIGATLPSVAPADGTSLATSTIIVNPIEHFTGNITLSDLPPPADLECTPIVPATISNSSRRATLSCNSIVAGTYAVTIIGTSGRISHNATAIFRFTASASPGFTITASSSVSFASGQTATSDVKVDPENGFSSQVELAATVSPSTGLSVSLNPFSLANGSGTSTATFRSFTQGNYTVTITATSGASRHTTTVNVHVAAVSHAPPAPSTTSGLDPVIFYGIFGGIIILVVAGTSLVLRRIRRSRS